MQDAAGGSHESVCNLDRTAGESETKVRRDLGAVRAGRIGGSRSDAETDAALHRLSRLEGLDEVEEFDMLLRHYCIVRAYRA